MIQNLLMIIGILSASTFLCICFIGSLLFNKKKCNYISLIAGIITLIDISIYCIFYGFNVFFIIAMITWLPTLINNYSEIKNE